MLTLTRKLDETIQALIGGVVITIIVTRIGRGNVRLSIDAPRDVEILRGELARKAA